MSKEKSSEADSDSLRLKISPVIERAEELVAHVAGDLSAHEGLNRAARGVARAAQTAEKVSTRLRRSIGIHRLPAIFLLVSIAVFCFWIYWQFFHTSKLRIAVSARDAVQLKQNVDRRVKIVPVDTVGSSDSIKKLQDGKAHLAFVQGGVDLPSELLRTDLESSELVLFFMRDGIESFSGIRRILTSSRGQGSHSLAQVFARTWGIDEHAEYVHDWRTFTDDEEYTIADDIDAVFVVKDPMSKKVSGTAVRLKETGFEFVSPDIGAMSLRLPYLKEFDVRPGYLDPVGHLPDEPVSTYSVATYLVARPDLTPRQMAAASRLLTSSSEQFASVFEPTLDKASEVAQGIEAVMGIFIYIGVAFLALLGIEILTYRRHFNELNSLVSLISMHQSSKDAIAVDKETRLHNIKYLSVCSDLLGLISVITGYYTQENSSLLYNRLLEIIHDRCDGLKINIQLKILHGLMDQGLVTPSDATKSNDESAMEEEPENV